MSEVLGLFIQLYTDEDVTAELAVKLRERGFVAQSTTEANMLEQDDEIQLEYAASHNMAIMTCNEKDFATLAKKWAAEGKEHAGIVLSEQFKRDQIGELFRQTLQLLDRLSADELRNALVYLSQFR